LSRFGGKATEVAVLVRLSDGVSTFRGEGDGPGVVAGLFADDVSTFRGEGDGRTSWPSWHRGLRRRDGALLLALYGGYVAAAIALSS
jgi:hypothetical protein